ncbi:MAG: aldolase/citrate lyase family protein [Ignavibacteria bacterium]|nr:aldolase/citrate lyase family protein [Ignavibacteria bacterium]
MNESGAAAVFDLEDSQYIPYEEKETALLKEKTRKCLFEKFAGSNSDSLISGVRLNNIDSPEFEKDLSFMESLNGAHNFKFIFLPKIENVLQMKRAEYELEKRNLSVRELIPIIETEMGYGNLESISEFCRLNSIRLLAFGHCDYNKDAGLFPFYHPGSDYLDEKIQLFVKTIERSGLNYVNTPFLELENTSGFRKILLKTGNICSNDFGQVTLSKKQTGIVGSDYFADESEPLYNVYEEETADVLNYAKKLVTDFEALRNGNGCVIKDKRGRVISPQEYESAVLFLGGKNGIRKKKENHQYSVGIIGGCLPVQENIKPDELYHQILTKKIKKECNVDMRITAERYDLLGDVLDLIKKSNEVNKFDCIIFHVRPDPYLLNTKLYTKYIGKNNSMERKLNLQILKFREPSLMPVNRGFGAPKRNPIKKILRNLNYFFGIIAGNAYVTAEEYIKLINEIDEYCRNYSVELIIAGPPARPRMHIEMKLMKNLGKKLQKSFAGELTYADLFFHKSNKGGSLFFDDKVHYNKSGHELFADIISVPLCDKVGKKYKDN